MALQASAGNRAVVQRFGPVATVTPAAAPAKAKPGINKTGFIDNDDGSNIRTGPAESGGQTLTDAPMPPATRVFVSGTHPDTAEWWYVTAFLEEKLVRGYVQNFRVNTGLPEPFAKLYQVKPGDTAEKLAVQEFKQAVRDGHDLRYYENVLLYVNRQAGRAGVKGGYQDPGVLGGGGNNVQLEADRRIWLVSPAYAHALESVVPDGSFTNGMYAKVKRFVQHVEDILQSVTDSPSYLDDVAGEYADVIREHKAEIIGIVLAFLTAEAASALLAATPTGVGQIAAVLIQLVLAAFGAAGMVQAIASALQHASRWLNLAWTAKGNQKQITEASKEFLRMLVSIAMAAAAYLGVKGNFATAVKIGNSLDLGGGSAFALAGGGTFGSDVAAVAVKPGFGGAIGSGTAAAMSGKNRDKDWYEDEYGDDPRNQLPKKQRISDGSKVELEDSGWLKKKLPDVERRREFMKWLEANHKQGEAHEHLRPGSPEAEEMLGRYLAENG
ncbi:MAG: hypothetical protein L0H24_06740 [Microlunatus sp.]|nr:hypothetical protein [Microlunatus sp.]